MRNRLITLAKALLFYVIRIRILRHLIKPGLEEWRRRRLEEKISARISLFLGGAFFHNDPTRTICEVVEACRPFKVEAVTHCLAKMNAQRRLSVFPNDTVRWGY